MLTFMLYCVLLLTADSLLAVTFTPGISLPDLAAEVVTHLENPCAQA